VSLLVTPGNGRTAKTLRFSLQQPDIEVVLSDHMQKGGQATGPGINAGRTWYDRASNQSPDIPAGISQARSRRHCGGAEPAQPAGAAGKTITMTNAHTARAWLLAGVNNEQSAIARRFVAVSTNVDIFCRLAAEAVWGISDPNWSFGSGGVHFVRTAIRPFARTLLVKIEPARIVPLRRSQDRPRTEERQRRGSAKVAPIWSKCWLAA